MAWTDPITFVSGNVLTAAQMNVIQANLLAGGPTYATEAARTTAIPSPFEGQVAYITGSTITTATGATSGTAGVPTGIRTIYNGSAWTTVTSVSAWSTTGGTMTATSYATTLTGDATAVSVTLQTGTTALVAFSGVYAHSGVGGTNYTGFSVSGATTLAAADTSAAFWNCPVANYNVPYSWISLVSGLTAGTNTFTLNYKTSGATGTWAQRRLTVQGVA